MPGQLAFPVTLNRDGQLSTNEQGSDADLQDSIEIVLAYEQGTRRGLPRFGIDPDTLFGPLPLNLAAITAAVAQSEPNVDATAEPESEAVAAAVENVRLSYGSAI